MAKIHSDKARSIPAGNDSLLDLLKMGATISFYSSHWLVGHPDDHNIEAGNHGSDLGCFPLTLEGLAAAEKEMHDDLAKQSAKTRALAKRSHRDQQPEPVRAAKLKKDLEDFCYQVACLDTDGLSDEHREVIAEAN